MNVHEFQAKEIFRRYGIPTPDGEIARTPEEAKEIAKKLLGERFVVKVQIHAGGRGKAGGIRLAKSPDEVYNIAEELLGKKIVTHQTGSEGRLVRMILVEKGIDIEKEYYVGVTLDRLKEKPVVIASTEGGVEIEEVAKEHPELIFSEYIEPDIGFPSYRARNLAEKLGLIGKAEKIIMNLARLYQELDVSLCEINPLVRTKQGEILALDAKIVFDDSGLFKHKEIAELYDPEEEDPREVGAKKIGVSYVGLDGNVGCLVNGAGLAMATMDLVLLHGGKPANFLDVGGGANLDQVKGAFKILLSDKKVRSVLVNIFGGIMRCDTIAQALVDIIKEVGVKVPIVVRLEGTNVDIARKILDGSGVNVITASTMDEAAKKAVEAGGD